MILAHTNAMVAKMNSKKETLGAPGTSSCLRYRCGIGVARGEGKWATTCELLGLHAVALAPGEGAAGTEVRDNGRVRSLSLA